MPPRLLFSDNPKLNSNPSDANFRVSLIKYVVPAPLFTKFAILVKLSLLTSAKQKVGYNLG